MARDPMLVERGLPTSLPRRAYIKGLGTVTVLEYRGHGYFWVMPKDGHGRLKHSRVIKFKPPKKPKKEPAMAKQLVKKALVTVLVHGGPKDGTSTPTGRRGCWSGTCRTYFKGKTLTLGQWVELYGNGKSRRTLEVAYDDIPRMVEFLVEALGKAPAGAGYPADDC